jgi:leader peptidase (prepilin peptidase)/N-methyltransferase
MPALIVPFAFKMFEIVGYGMIVGSYLPVVVYRVPRGISTVWPRSACPSCEAQINIYDIIPIFSWLILRGKCRSCHAKISIRYPLIEAAGAGLWIAFALVDGFHWDLLAYLVVAPTLVCLAVIDWQWHLLPRRIVWPMTVLTTLALANAALWYHDWARFERAILAAGLAWGVFALLRLVGPKGGLGLGDVRLALLLGLILGWVGWFEVVVGITSSAMLGVICALVATAVQGADAAKKWPFGTFLAIGTLGTLAVALAAR